jgi:cystathionine beta-lyase/cystathionine gamma-synthase
MRLLKANAWFGGMVSFNFVSGKERCNGFLEKNKTVYPCRIFRWSRVTGKLLGNDVHASIPEDKRKEIGIDDLVRLSVGIEDADDLIDDLKEH